jgi:hypothetical protein
MDYTVQEKRNAGKGQRQLPSAAIGYISQNRRIISRKLQPVTGWSDVS